MQRQGKSNHDLQGQEIDTHVLLDDAAAKFLNVAAARLGWSGRSTHRALKVARTIADLAGAQTHPGGSCGRGHAVPPRVSRQQLKVAWRRGSGQRRDGGASDPAFWAAGKRPTNSAVTPASGSALRVSPSGCDSRVIMSERRVPQGLNVGGIEHAAPDAGLIRAGRNALESSPASLAELLEHELLRVG